MILLLPNNLSSSSSLENLDLISSERGETDELLLFVLWLRFSRLGKCVVLAY